MDPVIEPVGGVSAPSGTRASSRATVADFSKTLAQAAAAAPAKKTTTPKASTKPEPATTGPGGAAAPAEPELKPTGEKLTAVQGHPYSQITSGADKGMYLNQAHGNPRNGDAFRLVQRGGRTFHVYEIAGKTVVEEIGAKKAG